MRSLSPLGILDDDKEAKIDEIIENNPDLSKEEILDAISEMSVIDIVDLISAMEEKFGAILMSPIKTSGIISPYLFDNSFAISI